MLKLYSHRNPQKGSAHVIIIVILALSLVGTLGFVFWQNFLKKDTASDAPQTTISTQAEEKMTQEPQQAYLTVKEWGIKVPQTPPSNVIEYTMSDDTVTATFMSSEQKAIGGDCGTAPFARYRIVRVGQGNAATEYMSEEQIAFVKESGNLIEADGVSYYIIGDFSGGECSGKLKEGESMTQAEATANANLLKSLRALQKS